jgi:DNA (cytosine-5)-methyltransferase 1
LWGTQAVSRLVLDLFSGIGGFALACEWVGWETIGFCEQDKFCQKVLAKHWPGVPIHDDIRTLDADMVMGWTGGRPVWGIVGGWPCQPFSVAGKQRGTEDDRHLWPEFSRLVGELRPDVIVGENVPGFIGLALDQVLADLEAQDYACGTVVLPAAGVNAPHRRDRVWIAAHAASSTGEARHTIPSTDEPPRLARHGSVQGNPGTFGHEALGSVGDEDARFPRRLAGRAIDPRYLDPRWNGNPLNAFDENWETGVPRVTQHETHRVAKLKALGNSLVPQVALQLFQAIEASDG